MIEVGMPLLVLLLTKPGALVFVEEGTLGGGCWFIVCCSDLRSCGSKRDISKFEALEPCPWLARMLANQAELSLESGRKLRNVWSDFQASESVELPFNIISGV